MNIELIHYFLTLEKHLNFTLAAEECFISQSSLSKHIKKLEIDLGVQLFIRDRRSVQITPEGKTFLKYAQDIYTTYREMQSDLCNKLPDKQKIIRVSSIPIITQYQLMPVFNEYQKRNPDVSFNITENDPEVVLDSFRNKKADIIIIRNSGQLPQEIPFWNFLYDELVVIAHKDHPFNQMEILSLDDLMGETILMGKLGQVNDIIITEFRKAGLRPKITYQNTRFRTVIDLVSKKEGITLAMKKMANPNTFPEIRNYPLTNHPKFALCVAINPSVINACVKDFISFLVDQANGLLS